MKHTILAAGVLSALFLGVISGVGIGVFLVGDWSDGPVEITECHRNLPEKNIPECSN